MLVVERTLQIRDLPVIYPDVVIVLLFVLNVTVNTGVVVVDEPTGNEAVLEEYIIEGPVPVPFI